jgi:hypothetical protein
MERLLEQEPTNVIPPLRAEDQNLEASSLSRRPGVGGLPYLYTPCRYVALLIKELPAR